MHQTRDAFCNSTINRLQFNYLQEPYQQPRINKDHITNIQNNTTNTSSFVPVNENECSYNFDNNSIVSENSGETIISHTFHHTGWSTSY